MISEIMRTEWYDTMESITERALELASKTGYPQRFEFNRKLFEATPSPDGLGVITLLMERVEEGQLGGNYNEFPWQDKGRSSWESKRERAEMEADRRAAEYAKIEMMKAAAQLKEEAIREAQRRSGVFMTKPRSAGVTASSVIQLSEAAQWNIVTPAQQETMDLLTGSIPTFQAVESTAVGRDGFQMYPGKVFWSGPATEWPSQSTISAGELLERLQTIERVLGRHLREQLAAAPSMGSVYAQGPGYAVTAMEIRQVVQALDLVAGVPTQFMPQPWGIGVEADFTAESEDGEKIVLSKDGDRFDSGVLFDPSNRPIRKFKLKELAA